VVLQAANGEQYIPSLTADGVHPSTAGFALMTPLAEQAIAGAPGMAELRSVKSGEEMCLAFGLHLSLSVYASHLFLH
jgi:hypothetical protein